MRILLVLLLVPLASARSLSDANAEDVKLERYRRAVTLASFKAKFTSFKAKVTSIPNNPRVKAVMEKLDEKIGNLTDGDNMDKLQEIATKLDENWDDLTGDDASKIASVVCDVVGTAAAFAPPPVGPIASTIMGILSSIIGGKSGEKSMADVVKEVIQQQLNEQYKHQLQGQIKGATKQMEQVQAFLKKYTGGSLEDRDFQFMTTQYDLFDHVELVGELENHVEKLAKSKSSTDASAAVELIDSYVVLTSMIELLMQSIKSILVEDGKAPQSVNGLDAVMETARKQMKVHLSFLRNPKLENAITVAAYDPEKHPSVEALLDGLGVNGPTTFGDGCYWLTNKYHNIPITEFRQNLMVGHPLKEQGLSFKFTKSGKSWLMKKAEGDSLVCAYEDSKAFGDKNCNNENTFRIYAFSDGGNMIINKKWPTSPLWLSDELSGPGLALAPSFKLDAVRLVVAKDHKWDEKTPEYVWNIERAICSMVDLANIGRRR